MFEQSVLDRIQVIEHSGIRIGGETVVYIDPIRISNAPHDADLILFTHPHFDHFSPRDAKKLMKESTVIAAPKSMALMCRLLLGRTPVTLLPAQTYTLCGIPVETVAAYNRAKPFHLKAMKWLGYILTIGETKVYISGDTDITEESKAVSCDIALLPVGGTGYTVNAEQAAQLAAAIAPHTVIPIHYGKLLGGADAAERFRAALDNSIRAEIRPSACSDVMISMILRAAVLIPAGALLGYLIGKYL
ncbi:MAG: MBL fold metallo-hydrolase [Oscillospiraceae bacterium]|nr:MBL fold metallo-hydrolase [Oscillospiraceae bacterium]